MGECQVKCLSSRKYFFSQFSKRLIIISYWCYCWRTSKSWWTVWDEMLWRSKSSTGCQREKNFKSFREYFFQTLKWSIFHNNNNRAVGRKNIVFGDCLEAQESEAMPKPINFPINNSRLISYGSLSILKSFIIQGIISLHYVLCLCDVLPHHSVCAE